MKKQHLPLVGFGLIMISFVYLLIRLLSADVPLNLATWGLWVIIDSTLLVATLKAAKEEGSGLPWSMIGFWFGACSIAAIAITKAFLGYGEFSWGMTETITVICVILALVAWKRIKTPTAGVVSVTIAMYTAMVPTLVDQWIEPNGQDPWIWFGCAAGCGLDFWAKPKKLGTAFQPGAGFVANGFAFILCIRQFF